MSRLRKLPTSLMTSETVFNTTRIISVLLSILILILATIITTSILTRITNYVYTTQYPLSLKTMAHASARAFWAGITFVGSGLGIIVFFYPLYKLILRKISKIILLRMKHNAHTKAPIAPDASKPPETISITAKLISILVSIVILLLIIFLTVFITTDTAVYIYAVQHPICLIEKDLGAGFAMIFWALVAFAGSSLGAILFFYPLYKLVSKDILKIIGGK